MSSRLHTHVRKLLKKDFHGYVLVTCTTPTEEGHMQVELSHDGDSVLASFLLENAQCYLEAEDENGACELLS